MPPKARGRRSRLRRPGETPDDRLLVIRATPTDADGAADEMVEDAVLSARQYVIEATPGIREVLYGISVFARHRPGVGIGVVVERFTGAAAYLEVAVGALRAVGFEIHPTGRNPDHIDIQLISGIHERDPEVPGIDLRQAATGVLGAGAPLQPNPAYIWRDRRVSTGGSMNGIASRSTRLSSSAWPPSMLPARRPWPAASNIVGDAHRETDEGYNWTVLSQARNVADVVPGSAVVMGSGIGNYLAKVVAWDFEASDDDP